MCCYSLQNRFVDLLPSRCEKQCQWRSGILNLGTPRPWCSVLQIVPFWCYRKIQGKRINWTHLCQFDQFCGIVLHEVSWWFLCTAFLCMMVGFLLTARRCAKRRTWHRFMCFHHLSEKALNKFQNWLFSYHSSHLFSLGYRYLPFLAKGTLSVGWDGLLTNWTARSRCWIPTEILCIVALAFCSERPNTFTSFFDFLVIQQQIIVRSINMSIIRNLQVGELTNSCWLP